MSSPYPQPQHQNQHQPQHQPHPSAPPGAAGPGNFPPGHYQPAGQYPPPPGPWPGSRHSQAPGANPLNGSGLRTACVIGSILAMGLGLSVPFNSSMAWASTSVWAAFAMIGALLQIAFLQRPVVPQRNWTIGAVGTGALVVFWVLVGLPQVSSNEGFLMMLSTVLGIAAAWLSPGRRI